MYYTITDPIVLLIASDFINVAKNVKNINILKPIKCSRRAIY